MLLYINLAGNTLLSSLLYATPLPGITSKRGDTPALQFQFGNVYGSPQELDPVPGSLTEFILGAKIQGDFPGNYIISNWSATSENFACTKTGGSTFNDAVLTAASLVLTSATAGFAQADVGLGLSGPGVATGATIASVQSATSCTLSLAATASHSPGTITISGRAATYTVYPSLNVLELSDLFVVDPTFLPNLATRTPANAAARYALAGLAPGQVVRQLDTQSYWQVANPLSLATSAGWTSDLAELASITLAAELTWQISGNKESSATFLWTIDNDYNQGGESQPQSANPPAPRIYVLQGTLAAGVDTGSISLAALNLANPPSLVTFTSLGKQAAGDANIFGAVVQSAITNRAVPFELTAPTDNANRIPAILVIP